MATPKSDPPRGVLYPAADPDRFRHARWHASADLAALVEHFWTVTWDLRGRPSFRQEVLPHPSVHLVVEGARAEVAGVHERRFVRVLEGAGSVFGIKLRPGAFAGFVRTPVSAFTNRMVPLADVFGAAGEAYAGELRAAGDDDARVAAAERFLRACRPVLDGNAALARAMVERVLADREITKVDDLVARFDVPKRALQRLFRRYVGVGAKWVIQRYRLHEAIAELARGEPVDWAALAVELGYFDQAHFIKHFKSLVGKSPGEYARTRL
jgi:AraC-like DNA-binding protein